MATRKSLLSLGAVLAMGLSVSTQKAQAIPTLWMSDGINTPIQIEDESVADLMPGQGMVGFTGPIGNFMINFTGGLTKPATGTDTKPLLDIVSLNSTSILPPAQSGGGGTLTIKFTETDFSAVGRHGALNFLSSIGGTTDGTVRLQTYLNESNNAFGMAHLLGDTGPLSGRPVAFSTHVFDSLLTRDDAYSLTMVVTVHHGGANQNTSFNAELRNTMPEPATLGLSWLAMISVGCHIRRRLAA